MPQAEDIVLVVQPGVDWDFPWQEVVNHGLSSTCVGSYGPDRSQESFVIDVHYADEGAAIANLLGYAKKVGTSLKRELPKAHPWKTWLYCSQVNVSRYSLATRAGPYQPFHFSRLALTFTSVPFDLVSDADLTSIYSGREYHRFTETKYHNSPEVVVRENGELTWVEGSLAGQKKQNSPWAQPVMKGELVIVWRDVPADYLVDSNNSPTKLVANIGKTNSAVFLGYPIGTLLFTHYELVPKEFSVDPTVIGLAAGKQPRYYDATIVFKHFDPPTDGTIRGHTLAAHPANKYWYAVALADNNKPIEEVAFTKLFQSWDAP